MGGEQHGVLNTRQMQMANLTRRTQLALPDSKPNCCFCSAHPDASLPATKHSGTPQTERKPKHGIEGKLPRQVKAALTGAAYRLARWLLKTSPWQDLMTRSTTVSERNKQMFV